VNEAESRLEILLVEDNPHDALWLEHLLGASSALPFYLTVVQTLASALERMRQDPPHCVLLDLSLPDSAGMETVRRAAEADPHIPVVVLTGADPRAGLEAVRNGAQEYLVKGEVTGDEVLRCVLWSVARAGVQAARAEAGASSDDRPEVPFAVRLAAPALLVDGDLRILEANEAAAVVAREVDRAGLVGRPVTDLIHADDLIATFEVLREVTLGRVDAGSLEVAIDLGRRTERREILVLRTTESTAEGRAASLVVLGDVAPAAATPGEAPAEVRTALLPRRAQTA
jgi:CheY-like chemotaxis protein